MAKTVLAALPNALLVAAASLGHDRAGLMREAGLDPAALADPDGRVPFALHTKLWRALAALGDDIGVALGERLTAGALGVVGHTLVHADTVGEALDCVARYRRLVLEDAVPKLVHEGDRVVLTQVLPQDFVVLRHPAECQVVATLGLARALSNERVLPRAATLPHARGASAPRLEHTLGIAPTWGAAVASLTFDAALLTRPLHRADEALFGYLTRRAEALLPSAEPTSLSASTRALLTELLPSAPTTERLAKRLGVSVRSLHRKLAEEGTSVSSLLDEIRIERARALLASSASVGQIALALGYSEHAAFTRAFKRWAGESPQEYRAKTMKPPLPGR